MPDGRRTTEEIALVKAAAVVIRRGSLSFSLASRLLGRRERAAIHLLYAWFRYCDDVVDAQRLGHGDSAAPVPPAQRLESLTSATRAALAGEPTSDVAFAGLAALARSHNLPAHCFDDFLTGMRTDVEGVQLDSFSDLRLYGYRVAGTVGQLFAHIVGVSDPAAVRHAVHLGIAMQLTNIARDVAEDAAIGRCYLPAVWLRDVGLAREAIMASENRAALTRVVARIVAVADRYYGSGDAGIDRLPFRAALAVATARRIYAEIGRQVVARGADAWSSRTVVSGPRKLWLLVRAVATVLSSAPRRILQPWKAAPLPSTWRFS